MAKLSVSADLVSLSLFRDADKCPVIRGATWDEMNGCIVLDIIGAGVPETDGEVIAQFTQQPRLTVKFLEVGTVSDLRGPKEVSK